jgi:hypothetical protein
MAETIIGSEDGSSIMMEIENTADYYFGTIVEHWNNSVNSMIQMGNELAEASAKCDKGEFATLQSRLEDSGVCSKKNQQALMNLPKSKQIKSYYAKCLADGNKPSLPTDLRVLLAVSQLEPKDFDSGIRNKIIGTLTTIGDINKLKNGTHKLLPEYKAPASTADTFSGKLVAKMSLNVDKIENKKQAKEVDEAIKSAMEDIKTQFDYTEFSISTNSVTEMINSKQEKLEKKLMSEAEKNSAWSKKIIDRLAKASPSELVTYDKSALQTIGKFASQIS